MKQVALRVDDVGAASKALEIYGHTRFELGPFQIPFPGNFLFFKYLKPFRGWGPYSELKPDQWKIILDYCRKDRLKLTLGITAGWVERNGAVVPFPVKYPKQADILKKALKEGYLEIANHGLTHCVLEGRAFRPRLFSGNRQWHREFWDWILPEIQEDHIKKAQEILQDFFEEPVVTFIPPGNIFSDVTLEIAKKYGLRYISCKGIDAKKINYLIPIPEEQVIAFHDKELIEQGVMWFKKIKNSFLNSKIVSIKEIGQHLKIGARE